MTKDVKTEWWNWHRKNPVVWALFKSQAFRAIRAGRTKASAYQIVEWLRWEVPFMTQGSEFKIPNDYIPFYARYFAHKFPEYKNLFTFKAGVHVNKINQTV